MSTPSAAGAAAVGEASDLDGADPAHTATIKITGFAASALDLGGDLYLLDLDGVALHHESYVTEHTSWSCLRGGATGEVVEASEASEQAIDALMTTFDAAYSERAGEIETVRAAVVAHAVARCHPITYAEQEESWT